MSLYFILTNHPLNVQKTAEDVPPVCLFEEAEHVYVPCKTMCQCFPGEAGVVTAEMETKTRIWLWGAGLMWSTRAGCHMLIQKNTQAFVRDCSA